MAEFRQPDRMYKTANIWAKQLEWEWEGLRFMQTFLTAGKAKVSAPRREAAGLWLLVQRQLL